jgi:hypothetical protein
LESVFVCPKMIPLSGTFCNSKGIILMKGLHCCGRKGLILFQNYSGSRLMGSLWDRKKLNKKMTNNIKQIHLNVH